jgi:hypothetical protein
MLLSENSCNASKTGQDAEEPSNDRDGDDRCSRFAAADDPSSSRIRHWQRLKFLFKAGMCLIIAVEILTELSQTAHRALKLYQRSGSVAFISRAPRRSGFGT